MNGETEDGAPRAMLPPPDVLVLARPRALRVLSRAAHVLWAAVALSAVGSVVLLVVDPIDTRPLVGRLAAAGLLAFAAAAMTQTFASRQVADLVDQDAARREAAALEAYLAEPHESLPVLQAVAEELAAEAAEAAAEAAVRAASLAAGVAKSAAAGAAGATLDEDAAAAARHAVAAADVAAAAVRLVPAARRPAGEQVPVGRDDLDDDVLEDLVADTHDADDADPDGDPGLWDDLGFEPIDDHLETKADEDVEDDEDTEPVEDVEDVISPDDVEDAADAADVTDPAPVPSSGFAARVAARIPQPTYSFWDDEPAVSAGRTPGPTSLDR